MAPVSTSGLYHRVDGSQIDDGEIEIDVEAFLDHLGCHNDPAPSAVGLPLFAEPRQDLFLLFGSPPLGKAGVQQNDPAVPFTKQFVAPDTRSGPRRGGGDDHWRPGRASKR